MGGIGHIPVGTPGVVSGNYSSPLGRGGDGSGGFNMGLATRGRHIDLELGDMVLVCI